MWLRSLRIQTSRPINSICAIEPALTARAERRAAAGRTNLEKGRSELKAAAADYKRLAGLAGVYNVEKAIRFYQRATEFDPADAAALYWLGKLSM